MDFLFPLLQISFNVFKMNYLNGSRKNSHKNASFIVEGMNGQFFSATSSVLKKE